ncbi:MAG: Lrp/AsnC family transcriptional regulator [Clostridiales bacterium]|nr:Lrp/AsnC family transcriptional regulator [Clostridiales bacterium]
MKKTILGIIEKNSRIDMKELAILLGISEIEVANAIGDMEKENIICGYHTMINWENTTEEKVTAMIEVMVTPQRGIGFDKIAERIYNFSEVQSVYLMSGGFDFMVILEEKTMKSVSQFISDKLSPIEEIRGTATHFVLKKYKAHGIILNEEKTDERMLVTP